MLRSWRSLSSGPRYSLLAAAVLLFACGTGIGLGVLVHDAGSSRSDSTVVMASAVKQDSDWLSEAYWRRKKAARAQRNPWDSGRSNLFGNDPNPFGRGLATAPSGRGGTYRTVCVRLCDGFYFPISFSTTRDRFGQDARTCSSRCSAPTRLYTYRTDGGSPETMTDVSGRPYQKLKTAFLYRTTYKPNCQCRPQPWSKEAKQRHAMYATQAWQKKARRIARAEARKARRIARRSTRVRRSPVAVAPSQASEAAVAAFASPSPVTTPRPYPSSRSTSFGRSRMGLGANQPRRRPARRVYRSAPRKNWRQKVFSGFSEN